ncbi:MAG TPA: putative Ig domain-containing protein [Gaiellaceae bacterium]|nr:putative Ig domain-containing protein [Gaiellaceae bacterium]
MKGVAAAALAAALAVCLALPAGAAPVHLQHVTVIGDSVADAISLSSSATAILAQGISLDLEVAPCRRVEGAGCPYDGVRPPSAIDLITSLGPKLGPNVVIAVGYNDFEDQYAGEIQDALAALKAAGVKHVWWLTMRAARHPYLTMNADIGAAAQESPQLTVVDWNVYSRSHPSWFRSDGIHLENAGAVAMATLIHSALLAGGVTTPSVDVATASLPVARDGRRYHARLKARAGVAPYRWSLIERAPAGIHLEPNGTIDGVPRARAGRYAFAVQVRDAAGSLGTRQLTLRIS